MSDGRSPIHHHNRKAWDRLVQTGQRFTRPAADRDLHDPLATVDGKGWLEGGVRGKDLLCLAAGGGKQSVLYASAGARVTVVDLSPAMLELDREVAAERKLQIRTIEASMDRLTGLADATFDIVIHPVSTCYVPQVQPVFEECARVLRDGGVYVSQHKSPTSLQCSLDPGPKGYEVRESYYEHGPLPPSPRPNRLREEGTLEFLHRWEQLIGGMCRAGFVIEDLTEPLHAREDAARGEFGHRACFIAPYVRIKARRRSRTASAGGALLLQ